MLVTLPGSSRLVRPAASLSLAIALLTFGLLATGSALGASTTPQDPVTLTVRAAGSGTVSSDPVGIDCGTTCSAEFASGTVVTLTAVAGVGALFDHWTGACSGSDPTCTLTLSHKTSAGAVFGALPTPSPSATPESSPTATPPSSTPGATSRPRPTQPGTGGGPTSSLPAPSSLPGESGVPTETPPTPPLGTDSLTQPGGGATATPAPLAAGLGSPEFITVVSLAAILTAAIVSIGIAVLAVGESRARQERRRPPPES